VTHPLIQGILEAHGAPKPASFFNPIRHRDFKIYPNEAWTTRHDLWMYEHDSYDGDEDRRIGVGSTVEECREDIDERFY
jgi:hypothetical protein